MNSRTYGGVLPVAEWTWCCIAIVMVIALVASSACSGKQQKAAVTHSGKGIVVAVDVAKSRVKINHEKIEGYMDAMTMWFDVKDAAMLTGISVDDRVEFTISEEQSADIVTTLRKLP